MKTIDFNSDVGGGFGIYRLGSDRSILECVSSANIACGMHAGDPQSIAETMEVAVELGVSVGAHPGFADLQGFGRRNMHLNGQEIYNLVVYQVGALKAFAKAYGSRLAHVKPHGALYYLAARDTAMAKAVAQTESVQTGAPLLSICCPE